MSFWLAAFFAVSTTLFLVVFASLFEHKLMLFPLACGLASFIAGYTLTHNGWVGAGVYLVAYVVMVSLHPMRRRKLDHDEEAWRSHRHLDDTK